VEVATRTAAHSEGVAATHRENGPGEPDWGEELIANELLLKLGLVVSPRTVGWYIRSLRPRHVASRLPSGLQTTLEIQLLFEGDLKR